MPRKKKFDTFVHRVFEAVGINSQMELASSLQIHRSAITQARNKNSIPDKWLIQLYRNFGLNPEWLEKGTGVKNAEIHGVHLLLPGFGDKGPTLEVFQYAENEEKPSKPKSNREGFGHIAFHVDNVEEMLTKIVKYGGAKLGEVTTKNFANGYLVFVYATDPEGNIVEIQKWSS